MPTRRVNRPAVTRGGGGLLLLTLIPGVNLLVYNRRYKQDNAALERESSLRLTEASEELAAEHQRLAREFSERFEKQLDADLDRR